jgi:hypothetical protein
MAADRASAPQMMAMTGNRHVAGITLLAIASGVMAASDAVACTPPLAGEGVRVIRSAAHAVAWRPAPHPIPLGAHFTVELAVCATDGRPTVEALTVDADMPAHRHGMNYRPGVTSLGGGRFRAEGLLFHMPGDWRLIVELRDGGRSERLTDAVVVD